MYTHVYTAHVGSHWPGPSPTSVARPLHPLGGLSRPVLVLRAKRKMLVEQEMVARSDFTALPTKGWEARGWAVTGRELSVPPTLASLWAGAVLGLLVAGLDRGVIQGRGVESGAAEQATGALPAPRTGAVSRRGWEAAGGGVLEIWGRDEGRQKVSMVVAVKQIF